MFCLWIENKTIKIIPSPSKMDWEACELELALLPLERCFLVLGGRLAGEWWEMEARGNLAMDGCGGNSKGLRCCCIGEPTRHKSLTKL